MVKRIFEGTINGTKYTDEEAYAKALEEVSKSGRFYSASSSIHTTTVPDNAQNGGYPCGCQGKNHLILPYFDPATESLETMLDRVKNDLITIENVDEFLSKYEEDIFKYIDEADPEEVKALAERIKNITDHIGDCAEATVTALDSLVDDIEEEDKNIDETISRLADLVLKLKELEAKHNSNIESQETLADCADIIDAVGDFYDNVQLALDDRLDDLEPKDESKKNNKSDSREGLRRLAKAVFQ